MLAIHVPANLQDRFYQDFDIGCERCLAHIVGIELKFPRDDMLLVKRLEVLGGNSAQNVLLVAKGKSRSSGYTGTADHKRMVMMGQFRTGTNKAHIAAEDVVKLREFIEFESTQETSDRSYTRIVFHGMAGTDRF